MRVTAWVSSGIVAIVLVVVVIALVWAATGGPTAETVGWLAYAPLSQAALPDGDFGFVGGSTGAPAAGGPLGWLTAAGMLFFAFAGYARMATLGEEVRDPVRTLPRAIGTGLAIVLVLYGLVAWATSP